MNASDSLKIEKLVAGGLGLGRLADGMVVLIHGVLPGEEVRFAVRRQHKSYLEADLLEILKKSPARVQAPCQYYADCGGCDLQHTDYLSQLTIKNDILQELLLRGKICAPDTLADFLLPPVPSPDIFAYRQRVRLQVNEAGKPGFFRRQSHDVIAVQGCLLAGPEINAILKLLHEESSAQTLLSMSSEVEILLNPHNSRTVLILHGAKKADPPVLQNAQELCRKEKNLQGVVFSVKGQSPGPCIVSLDTGPEVFSTPVEDLFIHIPVSREIAGRDFELTLEPGGFCQVNRRQNENCMKILLDWAKAASTDKLLDLYCGMGNFSIPFAMQISEVTGLDVEGGSIRSAIRNARMANLANCSFAKNSALEGIKKLRKEGKKFDLLLLDPPRSGCREVIPFISDLGIRKILMISCDPATLTRDLRLLQKSGYAIERLQIIDMFPQTHHIETITLLTAP